MQPRSSFAAWVRNWEILCDEFSLIIPAHFMLPASVETFVRADVVPLSSESSRHLPGYFRDRGSGADVSPSPRSCSVKDLQHDHHLATFFTCTAT